MLLVVALAVLIIVGFINNNVAGYIVWMSVAVLGGILVLWQKGQLGTMWVYYLLIFTAGFGFPIAVLCLKEKRESHSKEDA